MPKRKRPHRWSIPPRHSLGCDICGLWFTPRVVPGEERIAVDGLAYGDRFVVMCPACYEEARAYRPAIPSVRVDLDP